MQTIVWIYEWLVGDRCLCIIMKTFYLMQFNEIVCIDLMDKFDLNVLWLFIYLWFIPFHQISQCEERSSKRISCLEWERSRYGSLYLFPIHLHFLVLLSIYFYLRYAVNNIFIYDEDEVLMNQFLIVSDFPQINEFD